jgi:hypothetical protein
MVLLVISRRFDLLSEHVCGPISFSSIFAIIIRRRLTRPAPAEFVVVPAALAMHALPNLPGRWRHGRSTN